MMLTTSANSPLFHPKLENKAKIPIIVDEINKSENKEIAVVDTADFALKIWGLYY